MKKFYQSLKTWQKIVIAVILFLFIKGIFTEPLSPAEQKAIEQANKKQTEERIKEKRLETAQLMSIAGIKKTLKDPDSFKIIELNAHYINKNELNATIEVILEHTATNSFGGRVKSLNTFLYDDSLKLLRVKEF